jgi:signal transduction histidine kinase
MNFKRRYSTVGALLGLGAPAGLLFLRTLLHSRRRGWLTAELRNHPVTYGYVTVATVLAFAAFGRALGRREDRLIAAHDQVDRLRDEFVSIVAHDLRGPVQALTLQTQLLLRHQEHGEVRTPVAALERIGRATAGIARMVDDLLDAGRIEARRLTIEPQPTDLEAATRDLVERLRPTLADRVVEVEVAGDLPCIRVDPRRFDQILTNLLQNAGKYSDPGAPIRVVCAGTRGGAEVRVVDRGPGIAPDELPRLFERFYQTERARAKKAGGLGLGLYITKGLVEAHGGRIIAESTLGRGSTFRVWLPTAQGLLAPRA